MLLEIYLQNQHEKQLKKLFHMHRYNLPTIDKEAYLHSIYSIKQKKRAEGNPQVTLSVVC